MKFGNAARVFMRHKMALQKKLEKEKQKTLKYQRDESEDEFEMTLQERVEHAAEKQREEDPDYHCVHEKAKPVIPPIEWFTPMENKKQMLTIHTLLYRKLGGQEKFALNRWGIVS